MLGFLFSLINPLSAVIGKIADAKIAATNAKTDQERIHAQEQVDTLQARRDVMVAEAGSGYGWIDSTIRGMIAIGPAIYLLKIFIWDKTLGSITSGSTDPLDPNLWQVVSAVIGFYFLYSAGIGITRILKR